MSVQEARRAAFEAFYESYTQGWPVAISNCCREQVELIYNTAIDSVVVILPEPEDFDGYYNPGIGYHKADVVKAIESAGIRCEVKS